MVWACFIPVQIQVFGGNQGKTYSFLFLLLRFTHQSMTNLAPLGIQETPYLSLFQPDWCKWLLCTWISSMVWTMNVSCRSSMAPSIQLLKGAARLAYSRYNWSIVSSSFSVLWACTKKRKENQGRWLEKNNHMDTWVVWAAPSYQTSFVLPQRHYSESLSAKRLHTGWIFFLWGKNLRSFEIKQGQPFQAEQNYKTQKSRNKSVICLSKWLAL